MGNDILKKLEVITASSVDENEGSHVSVDARLLGEVSCGLVDWCDVVLGGISDVFLLVKTHGGVAPEFPEAPLPGMVANKTVFGKMIDVIRSADSRAVPGKRRVEVAFLTEFVAEAASEFRKLRKAATDVRCFLVDCADRVRVSAMASGNSHELLYLSDVEEAISRLDRSVERLT